MTQTLPLFHSRNVHQDLYVRALANVYRSGYRVYDPDFALSREPDIWEKARRDPVIAHAVELRLHMVAARKWSLDPASDRDEDKMAAKLFEELFRKIGMFHQARYELAEAVLTSRSFQYMKTKRQPMELLIKGMEGAPVLDWLVPTGLQDVDRRRFRWVPVNDFDDQGKRVMHTELELFSVVRERWERVDRPDLFIKHVYSDQESRLGYGRGLLEAIYFYHYAKGIVLREGLQGLERWSQGQLIVKIEGLREASTGKTNENLQNEWLKVLERMRSRNAMAFDKNDEYEVVQGGGEGHKMVVDFLNYLDNAMTRLILGAVLPSGGDAGGGSFARAAVEENTMETLIQYDRALLDEVITRDLVGMVWRANIENLRAVGLEKAKMPQFRTVHERREDPAVAVKVAAEAINAGIDLPRDEVYRKIGYPVPSEGEEVFKGREEPMAPSGFRDGSIPESEEELAAMRSALSDKMVADIAKGSVGRV